MTQAVAVQERLPSPSPCGYEPDHVAQPHPRKRRGEWRTHSVTGPSLPSQGMQKSANATKFMRMVSTSWQTRA